SSVFTAQADGAPSMAVDEIGDFHVDFSRQHHFHDLHCRFIGDPHAVQKFRFDTEAVEHLIDLRSTAVNDDGIEADVLQEHDVLRESILYGGFSHRIATVLDHD